MNAHSLAALLVRHAPWLRTAAVALAGAALLAGCSNPITHAASQSGPPRCADLVAHAFASAGVPVVGAYACLNSTIQAEGASAGVTDDITLAAYASQPPTYTSYRYIGKKFDATNVKVYYYFEYSPGPACWRASVDTAGLVNGGGWKQGTCTPLP